MTLLATSSAQPTSLAGNVRVLVGIAWSTSPRRVFAHVILLLTVGVTGGANLLLLIPIVNSLAAEPVYAPSVPIAGPVNLAEIPLGVLLAGVVLLTAAQAGLQRTAAINAAILKEAVAAHIRTEAFDAVLEAQWSYVIEHRRSDIISAVLNGAARSGDALSNILSGTVTAISALITAVVAFVVSPALGGVAVLGTLILGSLLSLSIRPAYRMGEVYSDRFRALQAVMTDSLDSLRLIRAHDAAPTWRRALVDAFSGAHEVQVAYVRHASTLSAASQVGLVASASLLVLAAAWLEVPPPTIVVVLLLIARLARSVQSLASTAQRLANNLPGVREIETLTAEARAAAESPQMDPTSTTSGSAGPQPDHTAPLVALRSVTFHYSAGGGGVEALDFEIPRGRMTALTGASGAGKSTTADLVLGLLRPDSGEVVIEGVPLTPPGLRQWRSRVAYVPQETVLIPDTLRRNLLWSVGPTSDSDCWAALDRAAATFARALPDGLDTELGERGIRLSGGERQRIAIARALLRQPNLLVLDEATSSLDDATEAAVLGLLAGLTPAVTVLVIAHRRSTIDAADHVIELADGRLVKYSRL